MDKQGEDNRANQMNPNNPGAQVNLDKNAQDNRDM